MTHAELEEASDLARDLARGAVPVLQASSSWPVAIAALQTLVEAIREAARLEGHQIARFTIRP